jgi:hypothetical protein
MSTAFEDAARVLFADTNLSRAAVYTPPEGDTIACRVLPEVGTDSIQSDRLPVLSAKGRSWTVLASQVTPAKGGTFAIDGETHRVEADPVLTGPNRLAWLVRTKLI